jgi:RNA methyltransferase, TrmH family
MARPTISGDSLRRVDSRQNARVKELRRAFADAAPNQQGEVAIEGMHMVEEAIRSGLRLRTVFFSDSARERAHRLLPQLSSQTETLLLPDSVFANAVPTETPQGIAALVKVKTAFALENILAAQPALLVVAAGLQDPGNLGTIARSAEAFGVTGLLLAERTVSPWNWKAIRASAGSLFRLPSAKIELAKALPEIKARGVRVLATSSHKGTVISDADLRGPIAIVVGGEGAGVPKDVLAQADEVVVIPQSPKVESLNAGIAASILLYEAARQRKAVHHGGTENTEEWVELAFRPASKPFLSDRSRLQPTARVCVRARLQRLPKD